MAAHRPVQNAVATDVNLEQHHLQFRPAAGFRWSLPPHFGRGPAFVIRRRFDLQRELQFSGKFGDLFRRFPCPNAAGIWYSRHNPTRLPHTR